MTTKTPTGTERARDEQRTEDAGPRYGGGGWPVADAGGAVRFGHARNDDANPSEFAPADADNADDDSPGGGDPAVLAAEAAGEITNSVDHAGMGRGDHPRATKSRDH